jgi:chaperonin cofactor prefoldin
MATGEIGPHGEGEWLTLKEAEERTGIKVKTLYRQAKRGRRPNYLDEERDLVLVWVTAQEQRSSSVPNTEDEDEPAGEPGSLAVPPERELFLTMLERMEQTIAPLTARIEELARENERLRGTEEQRSRDQERLTAELDAATAEAAGLRARLARPWWRRFFG